MTHCLHLVIRPQEEEHTNTKIAQRMQCAPAIGVFLVLFFLKQCPMFRAISPLNEMW